KPRAALATADAISGSIGALPRVGAKASFRPLTPSSRPVSQLRSSVGNAYQSRSSGREITVIISAASATVRVIGPRCDTDANGLGGQTGTRPKLALNPKIPLKLAGMRIEPPPSVPIWSAPIPAAAATAAPPDEPPGVRFGSHGLRVMPVNGLSVTPFQPNSGVVVLPSRTAPASRRRATDGASSGAGSAVVVFDPRRVGQPFASTRSLTLVGTPSTGPSGVPFCQRASELRADATAPSAS